MISSPLEKDTFANPLQRKKAPLPIVFTPFGNDISFNFEQSANALAPMIFNPSGSVIFSSSVHPLKARYSIETISFGTLYFPLKSVEQ